MTPQEWEELLFKHHIDRLKSISATNSSQRRTEDISSEALGSSWVGSESPARVPDRGISILVDGEGPAIPSMDDDADSAPRPDAPNKDDDLFPATLHDALVSVKERRLLYLSFRHLLLSCLDTLEALAHGVKEIIPAASRWLQEVWSKYGLMSTSDLCFRVKLFAALRKVHTTLSEMKPPPANRDLVKSYVEVILFLEPAIDLVNTLLVDVESWQKDSEMLEWAWRAHMNGEDISHKEVEELTMDVIDLPFNAPRPLDEERLVEYISDVRSRSDGYCLLFAAIERQASKLHAAKLQLAAVGPTTPTTNTQSTVHFKKRKTKKVSPHEAKASAAVEKMEWMAFFILKNMSSYPPSPLVATGAVAVLERISKLVGPFMPLGQWLDASGELKSRLKNVCDRVQTQSRHRYPEPQLTVCGLLHQSPVIRLLHEKKLHPRHMHDNTSSSNIAINSQLIKVPQSEIMASIEDIWFEVDPNVERIVQRPAPGQQERQSDELLVSESSGSLIFTKSEMMWCLAKNSHGSYTFDSDSVIRFPLSKILRYAVSRLMQTTAQTQQDQPAHDEKRFSIATTTDVGNAVTAVSGQQQQSSTKLFGTKKAKFNVSNISKKVYFIALHTQDEVFRFYPFYETEINQIVKTITVLTGLVPYKEDEYVQNVLTKRLEFTRRQALSILLQEENPWIDNSVDLHHVIEALTSETQPQRIIDMERLFHSCRVEVEVTKEAALLLRKIWHTNQSDQVRLKVLTIVDRLLDKVVMRQEDPTFGNTFKWLKHLEETVNPYKSGEVLKLIMALVRRAKMIQIEPLTPLVHNQCHSLFDNFDDFLYLQRFSEHFKCSTISKKIKMVNTRSRTKQQSPSRSNNTDMPTATPTMAEKVKQEAASVLTARKQTSSLKKEVDNVNTDIDAVTGKPIEWIVPRQNSIDATKKRSDWYWLERDEPHASRRKAMLKKYPQIRELMRHEPLTKYLVCFSVALQFYLAYLMRDISSFKTWEFWALAYIVGGTVTSSLVLSIHEITHFLAFKSFLPNKILACIANLPIVLPFCVEFKRYHMDHHRFQGVDGVDGDLPTVVEGYLFNNTLGKLFFCTFQILFYALRPMFAATPKTYRIPQTVVEWMSSWYAMNYVIQFSVMAAMIQYWGVGCVIYMAASVLIGGSLHPMAGHFLAEHYVTNPGQETYSYYGWMNILGYNVGYHNEHHDFPNIPWTLLPELRKIAPEYYSMSQCKSWVWIIIDFIRTPGLGPYSRIKRKETVAEPLKKAVQTAVIQDVDSEAFVGKEDI